MSIVNINNVSVRYAGDIAVDNASLEVYDDDFLGVIGPNGGGKTSLVKAILGLIPYEGSITFSPALAGPGSIGYLPQQNNFDKSFPISVREVILSGLQSRKLVAGRFTVGDNLKAEQLMEITGIYTLANKPLGQLSGGEMQRTILCRALISDPKLLILDEPANFVDNKFEKELYEILKTLNDRMAIIMVSHDLGTITSYVKSVVCVNRSVHRHTTSELTQEMLENYNCPIQLVSHGEIPHTVLNKHK